MNDVELEAAKRWAAFWTKVENWAFLGVIISLAIEFAALKLGSPYKQKIDDAKDVRIAELNNETATLRATIKPRTLTMGQHELLASQLKEFKDERVAVIASPSTPESDLFAEVLDNALFDVPWKSKILPGTDRQIKLFPRGVVVEYRNTQDGSGAGAAAKKLSAMLNDFGITATALPAIKMDDAYTMKIIINER